METISNESWFKTGLLNQLDSIHEKEKLIKLFNYAIKKIIELSDQNCGYTTIILPIILRINAETEINESIIDVILPEVKDEYENYYFNDYMNNIDGEAEFITYYCDKKIMKL